MAYYPGTPGNDFYRGTAEDDVMRGLAGSDSLLGSGGNDRLYGDDGNDNLRGEDGNDRLFAGAGDDFMRGGRGIDYFDGGDGFDRISFVDDAMTQGVIANLMTGRISNDGFGNRETMVAIEHLGGGSVFADRFYGNDLANDLLADRTDQVLGYGGDDRVQLGSVEGARIDGGTGRDLILLTGNTVHLTSEGLVYSNADHGVTIDLGNSRVIDDGFGFGARLVGFEDVTGTYQADRIIGSAVDNRLSGGGAADRLYGRDGNDLLLGDAGDDFLNGDAGADLLVGGTGIDRLTGGADADQFAFAIGDTGTTLATADRILDFEQGAPGFGDRIDLSQIDAVPGGSDDAFTFLGTAAFTGAAGEARYQIVSGSTFVYVAADAVAGVDLVIRIDGELTLTGSDFIL